MEKVPNEEIYSLNSKLLNEYSITELEERLENDPLFLSAIFNSSFGLDPLCACKKISDCGPLTCGCDGVFDDNTCACKKISGCPNLLCGCNQEYGDL